MAVSASLRSRVDKLEQREGRMFVVCHIADGMPSSELQAFVRASVPDLSPRDMLIGLRWFGPSTEPLPRIAAIYRR
jgi:hypothetical protein